MIVIARILFKDKEAGILRAKGDTWEVSDKRGAVLISGFVCFEKAEFTQDVQPKAKNNPKANSGKRGLGRGKNTE
jgi:hypothetical protein